MRDMRQPLELDRGVDRRSAPKYTKSYGKNDSGTRRGRYPAGKEMREPERCHFGGGGEGQDKRRGLSQNRDFLLASESRPFIAEAKAYEVRDISNGKGILTERNMQQLNRHHHEVRYSPRLCLPSLPL